MVLNSYQGYLGHVIRVTLAVCGKYVVLYVLHVLISMSLTLHVCLDAHVHSTLLVERC